MITIYTVNEIYGEIIQKRKALKATGKTVTFENGIRKNRISDRCAHFTNLDDAIRYFEMGHACKVKHLEGQIKKAVRDKASFDAFVAKERGEA